MGVWMPHQMGEQKKIALELLGECGSVADAARRLGYPSRSASCHRAKNDDAIRGCGRKVPLRQVLRSFADLTCVLANNVIDGESATGQERGNRFGSNYAAVQCRVNEMLA